MEKNLILRTDSYKHSHFPQYPQELQYNSAYIEPRFSKHKGVVYVPNKVMFYGLQIFLKEYLSVPIRMEDIVEAETFLAIHGEPFNKDGWMRILNKHGGYLPLEIQALPEGTVHNLGVPQVQIKNTDPELPWLTSFIETSLLRAVWYPSSVATVSWRIKQIGKLFLDMTADEPNQKIAFLLNDFGARGATSSESAGISGSAHLVNFAGTDTIEGIRVAMKYYNSDVCGFSIPAMGHSTVTSWGRTREYDAFSNMVDKFAGTGKMYAAVSDSYDLMNAVNSLWGNKLKDKVIVSGGRVVVRPDSGDPTTIPVDVVESLGQSYGYTINSKGYKVLHPSVRVIQGDGMNELTVNALFDNLRHKGWSIENVAIGMGGGLLQGVNRDTFGYAMKTNAVDYGNGWEGVSKNPKTDVTKKSKFGRQAVVQKNGCLVAETNLTGTVDNDMFRVVWRNGELLVDEPFSLVRYNSEYTYN